MRIEPDQIRINPNPLPEVVLIWIDLDRALRVRTKKGMACTHTLTIDIEHTSPGYTLCFTYLLISRRLAEVQI